MIMSHANHNTHTFSGKKYLLLYSTSSIEITFKLNVCILVNDGLYFVYHIVRRRVVLKDIGKDRFQFRVKNSESLQVTRDIT